MPGLCLGLVKVGNCGKSTPTVESKFSQNVENVNKLFNEINQQLNTEVKNEVSAKNKLVISNIKNSGSKLKLTAEQQAKAESLQTLNQVINMILDSNYSSDVKLDALINLSNDVKNDGNIFNKATSSELTDINLKNQNEVQTITNLNNNLRIIAQVIAENEMIIDGIELKNGAETELRLVQSANSMSSQVQDLVNDLDSQLSEEDKIAVSDEIEKSMSSESTGIATSVSKNIKSTTIITTIIIIVAILILVCIWFKFSNSKSSKTEGGNDRFIDDDSSVFETF